MVYFALPPKQYLPILQAIYESHNGGKEEVQKGNDDSKSVNTENQGAQDGNNLNPNLKSNPSSKPDPDPKNNLDIILEKPIGYNTKTAKQILTLALDIVNNSKSNIWLVDHYVAKDIATALLPLIG
jgi:glucose-6-phosphate 1-dehydrogenase